MKTLTSCIVKIISNDVSIDWFKPYKTDNESESIGTGFFIDKEGYIITCAHVVIDAIKIWITIPSIGKERIEVKVIGICANSDIALLKTINYKPDSFMKLGESDNIEPGAKVIAIGYPLGQDRLKQTSGIISGRQDSNFQTDSPINPGNSGGPLVTENFEVIGINSSKMMFADNIGYAKPIYQFKIIEHILRKLELVEDSNKMVYKPALFANFNNSSEELINYYNHINGCKQGYYVKKVHQKSVLKKANIEAGDIISRLGKKDDMYDVDNYGECDVSWNNEKVHIYDIMQRYTLEDTIEIHFWKKNNANIQKSSVFLGDMIIPQIRLYYRKYDKIDYVIFGGMIVMELTGNHLQLLFNMDISRKMADYLSLYAHLKNKYETILIITQIFPGSNINKLESLNQGDILNKVNNIKVNTLDEYRKALFNIKEINHIKYLKYESKLNTLVICDLEKILKEETFLSFNFKYTIDPIYNKFIQKYPEYNTESSTKSDNPTLLLNQEEFKLHTPIVPSLRNQFNQYNKVHFEQPAQSTEYSSLKQTHCQRRQQQQERQRRERLQQERQHHQQHHQQPDQPIGQQSENNILEQLKNIFLNPTIETQLENALEPTIYENIYKQDTENENQYKQDAENENGYQSDNESDNVKQNIQKYISQFRRRQQLMNK